MTETRDAKARMHVLQSKLLRLATGGCTCGTKSPTLDFHDVYCHHRQAVECLEVAEEAEEEAAVRIKELEAALRPIFEMTDIDCDFDQAPAPYDDWFAVRAKVRSVLGSAS